MSLTDGATCGGTTEVPPPPQDAATPEESMSAADTGWTQEHDFALTPSRQSFATCAEAQRYHE